ncbi:hypothetical protein LSCM4_06003 [Leishmania orientalis]|uniref:Nodulin-like domain-containing protein n=1 Tax=Leishmania orientalis TaxID=2249476 RepID=A0A836GNS6_9TRYP|nr:hypothetical protein LSCM4_06003 [Leishmania orientalis]
MADQPNAEVHLEVLASVPQKHISELHRFALLLVGSFGTICGSFGYAFTLVLPRMQERYNLSQRDLASVTTVGLVFGFFMLPFGTLYDYFGPLPVAILSMISYPLGAILTALCFEGVIEGNTLRLCAFNAFQSVGMSLTDIVCCMTVLSHFPSNRGPVIALLKTFPGLGSAIVGSFFAGFFNGQVSHYLFFLAVFAFLTNTTCTLVMRLPAYHLTGHQERHLSEEEKGCRLATKAQYLKQKPPMWRFIFGFIILIIFIIYLPTTSALVAYLSLGRPHKLGFAIVTAVLTVTYTLIAVPLPARLTRQFARCKRGTLSDEGLMRNSGAVGSHLSENEPVCAEAAASATKNASSTSEEAIEKDVQKPTGVPVETDVDYLAPQYQGSFIQNLCTLELWALWWTLLCVFGAEFVIIYNATFILGALQGSMPAPSLTALLTVLNGVGSAVGRLMMSFFEVWSQKRKAEDRVPITIALFFPTTTIIISIVLFLALPAAALPLPYVIAAIGNGFCAASQILVARTIFAKDPAKHYHFCFSATMVASVLLNRFLYGEWYTVQAEKQARGDKLCYGKRCVLMPLLVLAGLACSAFVTDVIVHFRYRSYCKRTLAERARLRGEWIGGENERSEEGEE